MNSAQSSPIWHVCCAVLCALMLSIPADTTAATRSQPDRNPCGVATIQTGFAWLLAIHAGQHILASQFDAAHDAITSAIALDDDNPALYVLRGQVQLARYEWDASAADYDRALAIDPDYADAYFFRGVLRYSILQTGLALREDALADFTRYLELAPQGRHADTAARYAESIQSELDALSGGW